MMLLLKPLARRCSLSVRGRYIQTSSTLFEKDGDFQELTEPWVPAYVEKLAEPIHVKRARLLYQSRKRGMLENDLLLSSFASKYLASMDARQLSLYDRLINQPSNDWDLYYWAAGIKETPAEFQNEVMNQLKEFVLNNDHQNRTRQPDLSSD